MVIAAGEIAAFDAGSDVQPSAEDRIAYLRRPTASWQRFALDSERFVRCDHSGAAALKATLASRNNHGRFARSRQGTHSSRPRCPFPLTSPRLPRSVLMPWRRLKASVRRP